jgi:hypothetical protein
MTFCFNKAEESKLVVANLISIVMCISNERDLWICLFEFKNWQQFILCYKQKIQSLLDNSGFLTPL